MRFKSIAPGQSYYFSLKLRNFLKQHAKDFDIIHAHAYHSFPSLFAGSAVNIEANEKFVFTPHYHAGGHTIFRSMLHIPYKYVGKKTFSAANKIICVSSYEAALVMKNFGINENKIVIIPNGVDALDFEGIKKEVHDGKLVLSVGRIEKYKGVQYIIEAFSRLSSEFKLDIVGNGPYKEHLISMVKKLHLSKSVNFYQDLSRNDLLQKYVNADLFVCLSTHEAFGISVAESLTGGVPCLVVNSSGLSEWIDNINCFGIDLPLNSSDLANKIEQYSKEKINRMNFNSWDDVTHQIEELYTSVLYS